MTEFPREAFADVLASNRVHEQQFTASALTGIAARGLAIITCMDSRIAPLAVVGMEPGDVKIIRNAGARVTDDVLRTLVLATYLLNVDRVLVMPHTECKMASGSEAAIHAEIKQRYDVDTRSMEFRTVDNQVAALQTDLDRIRAFPLLPADLKVGGAIYDVRSGRLSVHEG
jgi:carbonic anhydrase